MQTLFPLSCSSWLGPANRGTTRRLQSQRREQGFAPSWILLLLLLVLHFLLASCIHCFLFLPSSSCSLPVGIFSTLAVSTSFTCPQRQEHPLPSVPALQVRALPLSSTLVPAKQWFLLRSLSFRFMVYFFHSSNF